jgi:hypothetical protein
MGAGTGQGSLEAIADRPLASTPTSAVSPRFVVEHRSALNGRSIAVRGIVVSTPAQTQTASGSGVTPMPGFNPQPRVVVAESLAQDRDRRYDLTVLLPGDHQGYPVGASVDVKGLVDGNHQAVVLMWRE